MINRIVLVGSGNVASALAQAFIHTGMPLVQIYSRNRVRGGALAELVGADFTDDPSCLATADLYVVAVSDKAIGVVSRALAFAPGATVVHTSGSAPLEELAAGEWARGVLYPLQTFTQGRSIDFTQVPLMVECESSEKLEDLVLLAERISKNVIRSTHADRQTLHLAAVFACNFTNHMYVLGERLLADRGLSLELLKPLIKETADKLMAADSAVHLQTGPAARADMNTIERHLSMLREKNSDLENIYKLLSESIKNGKF